MKCPFCIEEEKKSKLYIGATLGTLMYCEPYYDEEGTYHSDDINTYTTDYHCSEGHKFTVSMRGDKKTIKKR